MHRHSSVPTTATATTTTTTTTLAMTLATAVAVAALVGCGRPAQPPPPTAAAIPTFADTNIDDAENAIGKWGDENYSAWREKWNEAFKLVDEVHHRIRHTTDAGEPMPRVPSDEKFTTLAAQLRIAPSTWANLQYFHIADFRLSSSGQTIIFTVVGSRPNSPAGTFVRPVGGVAQWPYDGFQDATKIPDAFKFEECKAVVKVIETAMDDYHERNAGTLTAIEGKHTLPELAPKLQLPAEITASLRFFAPTDFVIEIEKGRAAYDIVVTGSLPHSPSGVYHSGSAY